MKIRQNLYLDPALSDTLELLASRPRASKSQIVSAALRAYFASRAAREVDDMLRTRLDRISRDLSQSRRDLEVLLESLSLFIRYQLTVTAPLPESDGAARAIGRERFRGVRHSSRAAAGRRQTKHRLRRDSGGRRMTVALSADRRRAMIRTALGSAIVAALGDSRIVEIMINPDGALRLDILGEGRVDTGLRYEPAQVERIVRLVASHARGEVHSDAPIVSAELPPHMEGRAGERFEGILPPVSAGPCFSIRKPAERLHRLTDYVADGMMTADAGRILSQAVIDRRNIIVAGGTSSGKTTLANALLAEIASLDERVILIEDTRELQSPARDTVALRTRLGFVTMADLVRSTLRLRPDRIIVGEVRGPEALDMLKAWNTGHPGGIATVHANSAASALHRIEQLIQEAAVTVPRALLADAIDIIVFISGRGTSRRIASIVRLAGVDPDGGYALVDLLHPRETEGDPA